MTKRAATVAAFLAQHGYGDWAQQPITGDASARSYVRLTQWDASLILMDDPTAGTAKFAQIAEHLTAHDLSAPVIHAHDPDAGLMLLDDLGQTDLSQALRQTPAQELMLYQAATDVLIHLRGVPAPKGLIHLTPEVGAEMLDVLGSHYARAPIPDLMQEMETALAAHAPTPTTLALRDYHAENLIWRQDQAGLARVGLLDFQDAFVAPEGYDLTSLLRDARRDVTAKTAEAMIAHYMAQTNAPPKFRTQLAVLGVQRNLRILGVFARLAQEAGKTRYLAFMPRVWQHIMADLADPALGQLRAAVQDCVPAPEGAPA